ncbi:MAG: purine/pyrimidine permease [Lachnospiraceae bacterium]|nr:purine/pyrimidine permease [Lachnospiraceae bacterium]
MKMTYGINDKVPVGKAIPLAIQHVFTIFTGTIIGSTLLAEGAGLDINDTALIIQCGMLVCCIASMIQSFGIRIGKFEIGSRLPIITAGSYTLITPLVMFATDENIGLAGAFGAAIGGSVVLFIFGPIIIKYLHRYFTPVVTGMVVLSVGLSLVTTAVEKMVDYAPDSPDVWKVFGIAIFCAVLAIAIDMFAKGFLQSLSILLSMIIGYILCIALGLVDFSSMSSAAWVSVPTPMKWGLSFNVGAIVTVLIVHIATLMENIGDTTSIVSNAEDRIPTQKELMSTIRGDALGSIIAGFFNGLPVCSATQNAGVLAMSGCASRWVTGLGAIIFGVLAFFPKLAQILALIPNPVLGGVLLVAFGVIISSGIRVISMGKLTKRSLTIIGFAIAVGIGGQYAQDYLTFIPTTVLAVCTGISGSAITALILNIILPKSEEDKEYDKEFQKSIGMDV